LLTSSAQAGTVRWSIAPERNAFEPKEGHMRGIRSSTGVIAASVAMCFMAGAAVALASSKVFYEAGKRSKPPYLLLTVSHDKVTKVRWAIHEGCDGAPSLRAFTRKVETLNAPIKHGHFSKTVHYKIASGSPVGTSSGTTTVKGTIVGKHATVKVSDEQDLASYSPCSGSHKFKATETTAFH
jgi:hypothetical protein